MKKIALLLYLVAYAATAQVNNYNVGDVVDDFTVTDIHGVEHNLYNYTAEGKYVWLDFFFVDCAPCQRTTTNFNEFFDKYGCGMGDVVCISINNGDDTDQQVLDFEDEYGGPFNHAPAISADGGAEAVRSNFGINLYPTYCMVGPDNKLLVNDIWVNNTVTLIDFENTFPTGFEPPVMSCSLGVSSASSFDFAVYPTVSNGSVTISLNEAVRSEVTVYNVSGKRVFNSNYDSRTVQLDLSINSGVYFVSISSEYGTSTKKIMIK